LFLRERFDLRAEQQDETDRRTFAQQGRGNDRSMSEPALERASLGIFILGFCGEVVDMDGATLYHRTTGHRSSGRMKLDRFEASRFPGQDVGKRADGRGTAQYLAVQAHDEDIGRATESRRRTHQRV